MLLVILVAQHWPSDRTREFHTGRRIINWRYIEAAPIHRSHIVFPTSTPLSAPNLYRQGFQLPLPGGSPAPRRLLRLPTCQHISARELSNNDHASGPNRFRISRLNKIVEEASLSRYHRIVRRTIPHGRWWVRSGASADTPFVRQEALMHQLAGLTVLGTAQYLKMVAQSHATDAQSVPMTEQSLTLAELQVSSEDSRTGDPRSRSPATDIQQDTYSTSATRLQVPKFHGVEADYPMWLNSFFGAPLSLNRREADASRAILIIVDDEKLMPSELRRRHSKRIKDSAKCARGQS